VTALGPVLVSFFADHLTVQKGLRPASVRSYRDTLKLFLRFVAREMRRPVTRLSLEALDSDRVLAFLHALEAERHNHVHSRNQRLAGLRTFYRFVASHHPEMLEHAERVERIAIKRSPASETHCFDHEQIRTLFAGLPTGTPAADRDRALLMLLYNTGARVQEIADLRVCDVDLQEPLRVRLRGKGDKWRACPLWPETASLLRELATVRVASPESPLFQSRLRRPLTRFGIYKLVKRHCGALVPAGCTSPRVSPHLFRHTTAVHLLEAGVDVNVIRGWLGHVSLATTYRYTEISLRMKQAAVALCAPPVDSSAASRTSIHWRADRDLLQWLEAL
jgi:site-specific recombinase XerD